MNRIVQLARLAVTAVLLFAAIERPASAADEFPAKPVRMIVPLSAGSAFDLLARAIGNTFKERTGQPIIVENRPGANMGVAANACKSAPPDGYTVCLLTQNAVTLNPLLYAKLNYDPVKELDPVAVVAFQQQVLVVVPSLGVTTFADLVKYSKANPNKLNYASLGLGSDSHLLMEWLKGATGADITHVPFNGSPPILTALKSGQVHLTLLTTGTLKPHIELGRPQAAADAWLRQAQSGIPGRADLRRGIAAARRHLLGRHLRTGRDTGPHSRQAPSRVHRDCRRARVPQPLYGGGRARAGRGLVRRNPRLHGKGSRRVGTARQEFRRHAAVGSKQHHGEHFAWTLI